MFPSFLSVLGAAVLTVGQVSGPAHTWIADVKASRGTLAGQDIRIEGEVVDVRSTSPAARRGFYRLVDASDAAGVLVRTENIPIDGGTFRLRAKIAGDQMVSGALLLDEVERDQVNARPLLPILAALASALVLFILLFMLRRAIREERQYAVSPPLWLLPDAGPYGKPMATSEGAPIQLALKYEPELEEADRVRRTQLTRRKRSLAQAVVASLAVTGSSAAWVVQSRPAEGQVPAFIFIDSNDPDSRASRTTQLASADTALSAAAGSIPVDTGTLAPPPVRVDTPRTAPGRVVPRTDPLTTAPRPNGRRDTVTPPRDSVPPVVPSPAPAPPPPAPLPMPPPPPPPPPPAPVRDPAAERARAESLIQGAATRLVAAINGKRATDVALLVPEGLAGDLGRRERFLKLIREFGPQASLAGVEGATMEEDRGEARLTIAFTWRGDFGVDRKKSGRLVAFVRRDGDDWRYEGARLIDAIP